MCMPVTQCARCSFPVPCRILSTTQFTCSPTICASHGLHIDSCAHSAALSQILNVISFSCSSGLTEDMYSITDEPIAYLLTGTCGLLSN